MNQTFYSSDIAKKFFIQFRWFPKFKDLNDVLFLLNCCTERFISDVKKYSVLLFMMRGKK